MADKPLFRSGGIELVDEIEPMWRKLTLHASEHSQHFAEHFAARTFPQRRDELREKAAKGALHIDIAKDERSGTDLGYCVSSVDEKHCGEIESLFVDDATRGRGVGDLLVRRSIDWMEKVGARSMAVFTVYGSEDVLPFYARYGFRPKMVMLERQERADGRPWPKQR
jgi:GNAT superfamily N-acetyltransferase